MAKDYYQILGVAKTATKSEIGKAYRELAKKFHPDLHPDDEGAKKRFQEIQEAYDALNNDEKRKMYDQFGPDFEDMMKAGFRPGQNPGAGGGPGAGPGGFRGRRTSRGPGGAQYQEFTFDDLFGGNPEAYTSGGQGFDPTSFFGNFGSQFRGAGAEGPTRRRRAPTKGDDITHEITIPFQDAVLGTKRELRVSSASGEVKTVSVTIPAGFEDGKKLKIRGFGEPSLTGGAPGDLMLLIHVSPHPLFTRQDNNLLLRLPVTLAEATLGAKIDVPFPKGRGTLNIPAGTSSGRKLRVKGAGVPAKSGTGDLIVEILVNVPRTVTEAQAEVLRQMDKNYDGDLRTGMEW